MKNKNVYWVVIPTILIVLIISAIRSPVNGYTITDGKYKGAAVKVDKANRQVQIFSTFMNVVIHEDKDKPGVMISSFNGISKSVAYNEPSFPVAKESDQEEIRIFRKYFPAN